MSLLESPTSVLLENASLLLRILTEYSPQLADTIREKVLTSGILLNHFYYAIFSYSSGQRVLSRYLCGIWMAGTDCAERQLLKRILPSGFFSYLSMPILSLEEENQLSELEETNDDEQDNYASKFNGGAGTNIARFRLRARIAEESSCNTSSSNDEENFSIFFHVLTQDHCLPDLIWNANTRTDLKNTLESEMKVIDTVINGSDVCRKIAWNHEQFNVEYPSLENEVRVGSVYMRLWLEASESFIKTWDDPMRLFELLFRRLLCDIDQNRSVSFQQTF